MSSRPPEAVLWDFMRGALMTRALGVVADAGIADALASGPKDVAQLASEVGADRDALERLMDALASDGVFERRDDGVFANTDASELLRNPSQRALAHLFGGVYYRAVAELDATGASPAFARAHGTDLWSWLAENPTEREMSGDAERRQLPSRAAWMPPMARRRSRRRHRGWRRLAADRVPSRSSRHARDRV